MVLCATAVLGVGCGSGDSPRESEQRASLMLLHRQQATRRVLERKLAKARREARLSRQAARSRAKQGGGTILKLGATHSFEALAVSMSARVGLAVAPLGSGGNEAFGSLQAGHAWSSIKVPILVTLMRDRREGLTPTEMQWASAAIEASDNDAAASLFHRLERIHGGLNSASKAVQGVMALAGNSVTVATAPPPPGAVSTYGQTQWSIDEASAFYRALANGCLLDPSGTEYVLDLMRNVIPEQQWGLGEAGFDPSWSVAIKGGWGSEAESGSYLVRQSGVVQNGPAGIAVTMIAEDAPGSFPAGIADLTRMATWLRENIRSLGPPAGGCP
jgi:beta-lactamase class A